MTRAVALLRAVNIGPHGKVAMADLKVLFAAEGFSGVSTLLQSGNVVFSAGTGTGPAIEGRIEAALAERLGLKTDVMVRTAEEWAAIVAGNPYSQMAADDPGHLVVMALKSAPKAGGLESLRKAIAGRETAETGGREAYLTYPDGIGRSKLSVVLIERHLGTRGTGRNWNTVLKIAAALGS